MATIKTQTEKSRGCGYRKPGGIYLVCDGPAAICYKLPIPLTVCPCCSAGIKPTRGFTWINSNLFAAAQCGQPGPDCGRCASNLQNTRMGLLWIGEKFYGSPHEFIRESGIQGISRRIHQVPRDFEIGKTFIALAHRKCVNAIAAGGMIEPAPGVFSFFRPQRIEYIVKGSETIEELDALEKRGFTLINVIPDYKSQQQIFNDENNQGR